MNEIASFLSKFFNKTFFHFYNLYAETSAIRNQSIFLSVPRGKVL